MPRKPASILAGAVLLVSVAACASPVPPSGDTQPPAAQQQAPQAQSAVATQSAERPPVDDVAAVAALREAMARQVPKQVVLTPERQAYVIAQAQASLEKAGLALDRPQVLLVVDRNPKVQEMNLVLARPGQGRWEVIGGTHVSTGKPGRKEHFKTPVGVFLQDGSILGYRAHGTYNQNHIRGLGIRNSRVWDLGWQDTEDWRHPGSTIQIRLSMHATDPDVLEPRIGRPDSEGCVRIPAALNRFLDHYGVFDADIEQAALSDARFGWLLPGDREPTPIAGNALVVYDSSAG